MLSAGWLIFILVFSLMCFGIATAEDWIQWEVLGLARFCFAGRTPTDTLTRIMLDGVFVSLFDTCRYRIAAVVISGST